MRSDAREGLHAGARQDRGDALPGPASALMQRRDQLAPPISTTRSHTCRARTCARSCARTSTSTRSTIRRPSISTR